MLKFIKQKSIGAIDWIRSKDDYGAPINLTYEGEDSFKTLPGGIISLLFYFIFAFYCLISGLEMKNSQNWSLTQQSIVANTNDLMEEIRLADLTNISMGI